MSKKHCIDVPHNGLKRLFHREYAAWIQMKQRCSNPNAKGWHNYGGRGICVCKVWRQSFRTFLIDMGTKPSPHHSIDRINNDGDYEPKNCRWATYKQQHRNRRNNTLITFDGMALCIAEWAERTGISSQCILDRIHNRGWSIERALTTPPWDGLKMRKGAETYTCNGETKTVAEWSRIVGITLAGIHVRRKRGMSLHDAIFTPSRQRRGRRPYTN